MTPRPRVVSLLSSATEILCALGLEDCLLAVTHECDWPPRITTRPRATISYIDSSRDSRQIDDQVKSRLQAGQPLYGVNESLLQQLAPDLIITQAQCDVCAVRYDDVINIVASSLQLSKTQVLALNPTSLDQILQDVLQVGEVAGALPQAKAFFDSLTQRVDRVRYEAQTIHEHETARPRVICIEWVSPLMTAGNWTPELIELAGGQSGVASAGQHSQYVAWKEIVTYDPELLLIAPCGFDLARSLREARVLPDLPDWESLSAVRSGRVFVLDGNALLNRSGPRIVDSLELIAHLVHPAHFPRPGGFLGEGKGWQHLAGS